MFGGIGECVGGDSDEAALTGDDIDDEGGENDDDNCCGCACRSAAAAGEGRMSTACAAADMLKSPPDCGITAILLRRPEYGTDRSFCCKW